MRLESSSSMSPSALLNILGKGGGGLEEKKKAKGNRIVFSLPQEVFLDSGYVIVYI